MSVFNGVNSANLNHNPSTGNILSCKPKLEIFKFNNKISSFTPNNNTNKFKLLKQKKVISSSNMININFNNPNQTNQTNQVINLNMNNRIADLLKNPKLKFPKKKSSIFQKRNSMNSIIVNNLPSNNLNSKEINKFSNTHLQSPMNLHVKRKSQDAISPLKSNFKNSNISNIYLDKSKQTSKHKLLENIEHVSTLENFTYNNEIENDREVEAQEEGENISKKFQNFHNHNETTNITNHTSSLSNLNNTTLLHKKAPNKLNPSSKFSPCNNTLIHQEKMLSRNSKSLIFKDRDRASLKSIKSLNSNNTLNCTNQRNSPNNANGTIVSKSEMSNFNETLHVNLEKLGNLRRNKSLNIKQQGIQIIDEIIKGLSKLKTIIADEETNETHKKEKINSTKNHKTINYDNGEITRSGFKNIQSNPNNFPSILPTNYTQQSNKLLISSTTGEVIKIENKKIFNLMKNKTINQKTIDHDQSTSTIKHDEEYNRSSLTNNESLMMQIKTNQNERSKSFIANRYSLPFQENTETLITDLNLTGLNRTSIVEENSRSSNILYNPIETLKNTSATGDYKFRKENANLINLHLHQNLNKVGNKASRFTIDNFQYNVLTDKKKEDCDLSKFNIGQNHNNSVNTSSNFKINLKFKKDKQIAIIPVRNSRNSMNKLKQIDFEDFANYEFID